MAGTRRKKTAPPPPETPPIFDETVVTDEGENVEAAAPPDAAEVEIEAEIPSGVKGRAQRLADRIKGMISGTHDDTEEEPTKRKALSVKRTDELGAQLCLLMAMIICWLFDAALAEPYKPVAPNATEAQAMTAPIARIIARRIKAAGKMSADTLDYLMLITAITLYADRARHTYRDITQLLLAERQAYEESGNRASGPIGPQAALAINRTGSNGGSPQPPRPRKPDAGGGDGQQNHSGPDTPGGPPVDPMDALLAADAAGRAKHGLV